MEKFRHFGDAATGIHPFTTATAAAAAPTVSRISAACAFPPRLLLSAVFVLLLFVTDTLLWVCHVTHLGLLGRFLFAPLQRACLRGLLFAIGHILPEKSTPAVKPQKGGEVESSSRAVRAGDLVVCNLQSVWDALVFEVMLAQPYHAVCFPDATTAVDIDATSPRKNATVPGLRVFWPGPMQRWRVWAHTRRTGTLAFLAAQHPDSIAQQAIRSKTETAELPLHRVQEAAARAGVPVWWFGEGTCSNGRGLLLMPAVTCMSAAASDASAGCLVHLATIQYVSPALQNVLGSDLEGLLMVLFRTGPPLHGSMAPAWTSPLLPTAEVTFRSARLARAAPLAVVGSKSSSMKSLWTLSTPALLELRHIMCQRGQALVMSSSAASVRRQPLSVGLKEKKGFIEAYHAMLDSHKAQQSA